MQTVCSLPWENDTAFEECITESYQKEHLSSLGSLSGKKILKACVHLAQQRREYARCSRIHEGGKRTA